MNHSDAIFKRVLRSGKADFSAIEKYLTFIFLIGAKQALHHGGLARAILAHKTHDRTPTHFKINMIKHAVAAEGFAHALNGEDDIILQISHFITPLFLSYCSSRGIFLACKKPAIEKHREERSSSPPLGLHAVTAVG